MRRTLVIGNMVIGVVATIILFNGPLQSAVRPYNSYAATSWGYVAAFAFVIVVTCANIFYIHQTVARPFERWKRFVAAWQASSPTRPPHEPPA